MVNRLYLALALWLGSYSFCYSETTYGVTNNAALGGLSWDMGNILPDATPPWITVQVNGLSYRYTIAKDPSTDSIVYVRNEDAINGGYIFEEADNWSGTPGGSIRKYFRLPYIDSEYWGRGSIDVEGDGTITNATIVYNYRMDVNDQMMKCAASPLVNPECPGFADALAKLLASQDLSPDDPFYDQWVQAQLDKDTDVEEEEKVNKDEEQEEEPLDKQLGAENTISELGGNQAAVMAALAFVPKIETYYAVVIPGGVYEETLVMQDATLPDNPRALRNLASDETHRTMVRSQYDREQ